MGNTLVKDVNGDKRFGDSLLAQEVKKIMTDQQSVYNDKPINIHLAKACCKGAAKKDASQNPNAIISIGFPRVIDKAHRDYETKCAKDGICLERYNVGFQVDGDYEQLCGKTGKSGQVLSEIATGDGGNSQCDNFMSHYCAKTLYDQGCIGIGKNPKGKIVPKFFNKAENKMCWDGNKMSYGPPECACLNSLFGPNLNTNPSKNLVDKTFGDKNPYGVSSDDLSDSNMWTKYSLNIFKTTANKQFPKSLDARCTAATTSSDSGIATAWTLSKDKGGNVSICLNQINIADSDIGKADFSDIKQTNNCGPPGSDASNEDAPVDPSKKADPVVQAENAKTIIQEKEAVKKIEEEATKKRAEDEAKIQKIKDEAEALKKALEQKDLDAKKKAEEDKKKAEDETAKKRAEDEAAKKKAEDEAAKKKADDEAAKKIADELAAKKRAEEEDAAKKKAEEEDAAKKKAEEEAAAKKKAEEEDAAKKKAEEEAAKARLYYMIGGGVGLLVIILVVFLMFRNKNKSEDE
jgi:hypothetical protein